MLKLFRKKIVSKIILWGLLILILPAFVMWGSASMSRSKEKGPANVGVIDGRKVSFDDFYNSILGVRTQIMLNYYNQPNTLDVLLRNKPLIAKIAWDRLLLLDEAKKSGIKAPDKDVIETIKQHPLFLRNGTFDEKFYSYILSHNIGLEPRAFEEIIRDNIKINRLSSSLTKEMKVTDEEVLSEYNKEFAKIKISYILLEPKDMFDQIKIEDKAVSDFYGKHKGELMVKSGVAGSQPERAATFDEAKETIKKMLKELEARKLLKTRGTEVYDKITEDMKDRKSSFESAAGRQKLAVKNTDFFSKGDKVADLTDIAPITDIAPQLKDLEVSKPVETDQGCVIFEIIQRKAPEDEAFKKDKDDYAKKVHARRSDEFMEGYLRKLEEVTRPAIKFEDIEKYYK